MLTFSMEATKINDFDVKPLTAVKKSKREVELDVLPDPKHERPFFILISAKIASGKSVLLSNLLKKKELYFRYFDKVYMCTSNVKDGKIHDDSYNGVKFNEERLYDDFNEPIFSEILDDITSDEDFKNNSYLLICDDLGPNFERINKNLLKGILKHRHYRLSIILVSQAVRLFNPKLRQNASHLIAFYTDNKKEREALNEITNLDQSKFNDIFEFCTNEPYSFMFVNLMTSRKVKIYRNFNEEIKF